MFVLFQCINVAACHSISPIHESRVKNTPRYCRVESATHILFGVFYKYRLVQNASFVFFFCFTFRTKCRIYIHGEQEYERKRNRKQNKRKKTSLWSRVQYAMFIVCAVGWTKIHNHIVPLMITFWINKNWLQSDWYSIKHAQISYNDKHYDDWVNKTE